MTATSNDWFNEMRVALLELGWNVNEHGEPTRDGHGTWQLNDTRSKVSRVYHVPHVRRMPEMAYAVVVKNVLADIQRYWLVNGSQVMFSITGDDNITATVSL